MAISTDYPRPITVNGYVCRNCDDVSKARKFEDPSKRTIEPIAPDHAGAAVSFGGTLADRRDVGPVTAARQVRLSFDRYA